MTASASRCSGACAEPMVSRQPAAAGTSSRTIALVRSCAPDAAATAGGSVPRPPVSVVKTGGGAAGGPGRGGGSSEAAAAASDAWRRDASASPGRVASKDSSSDRPAYTPPSSGLTSRSTTSWPNRADTKLATGTSASRAVAGSSGSRLARASPAADSTPLRPSAARSPGTPMNCRAGSGCIPPRLQIRAATAPGLTRCPSSPAPRISSTPSGRRASRASAPSSTLTPAISASDSLPPSRAAPSSTITCTGSPRRKYAAASPAMPPPTIATTGRAPDCSTRSP